jgi:hypothetical protein
MKKLSPISLRLSACLLLFASIVIAALILYIYRVEVIADDFANGIAYHYFYFEGASGPVAFALVCIGAFAWFLLLRKAQDAERSRTD